MQAYNLVQLAQDSETNRKIRLICDCFRASRFVAFPFRVVQDVSLLTMP